MNVLLADHFLAVHIQRHIELRQLRQRRGAGLQQERKRCHLHTFLLAGCLLGLTEAFHVGDIRVLELGDVRHVQPATLHIVRRSEHHARHGFTLNFTKLTEVRQFHTRNAGATATSHGAALLRLLQLAFHVRLDIVFQDATLRAGTFDASQIRAEFTGQLTHRRSSMNLGTRCRWLVGCRGLLRFRFGRLAFRFRLTFLLFLAGRLRRLGRRVLFAFVTTLFHDGHFNQIETFGDLVAFGHQNLANLAGIGRRNLHGGLVGLHGHQRIVRLNLITFADVDLDHRHIVEAVQRGHLHGFLTGTAGFLRCRLFLFRLGFFARILVVIRATSVATGFHHANDIAFLDLVTHFDGDLGNFSGTR